MTNADINNNIRKVRRTSIPERPEKSLNLLGFLKQTIGKELSQLSFPVQFNEPLSMLQRSIECVEARQFLDLAATTTDLKLQAAYVAVFNVSTFLRISDRLKKPFNPMLAETFELDLWNEQEGLRVITEQVTHHPPMTAVHIESKKGWVFESTIAAQTRFKLTALAVDVTVTGASVVTFKNTGYSYNMGRPETMVKFLKGSQLFCNGTRKVYRFKKNDVTSDVESVFSLTYGEKGILKSATKRTFSGRSPCGEYTISSKDYTQGSVLEKNGEKICEYRRDDIPGEVEREQNTHGFANLQIELNQFDESVCATDSRFRPDQRLMELGSYDNAEILKKYLEDKQRKRRKDGTNVEPRWFIFKENVRHHSEKSTKEKVQLLPRWTHTNDYFSSKQEGFDETSKIRGDQLFLYNSSTDFCQNNTLVKETSQLNLVNKVENLGPEKSNEIEMEIKTYLDDEKRKLTR